MGLLELVKDGFFGVGAHAGDAGFVQGPTRGGRVGVGADIFCAGSFEHFSGSVAHVFDHGAFIFVIGHVNFEDGDAEDVFFLGIDLDEIVEAREDFAEAGDLESFARLQDGLFETVAEARGREIEIGGGFAFVAVATEEFFVGRIVFEIAEAGDVNADGLVGARGGFLVAELGEFAFAAAAANVGGEVVAECAAGIGEAVGMFARAGVEEDARRFLGLRAKDDGAGGELVGFFRDAIDVEEAASAIGGGVHQDFVDHRVGDEFALAGLKRIRNGGEGRIEIGMGDAAAFTGAAVVARAAAVDGLGEICGAG